MLAEFRYGYVSMASPMNAKWPTLFQWRLFCVMLESMPKLAGDLTRKERKRMIRVHKSTMGTYHPVPGDDVAWTVNDTRGYTDSGPRCDACGACECGFCEGEDSPVPLACRCEKHNPDGECVGLSFAYVCLDGGYTLCEECAEKEGLEVLPCDCK